MSVLRKLSRNGLRALAEALESQRLHPPFQASLVQRYVPEALETMVAEELQKLVDSGMAPEHIALMARLLAEEREAAQSIADRVELVWSGMDVLGAVSRDTRVVIRELFKSAKKSVLVSTYVIDAKGKARSLFEPLAKRMDEEPDLKVRLFVNVPRPYGDDQTPDSVLLREFADTFRAEIWPGNRLPEVFHDPRSLATNWKERASLHAKCVVVDQERVLITSANFTRAAQERNIEAGTTVQDKTVAEALCKQFNSLVDSKVLVPVPLGEPTGS